MLYLSIVCILIIGISQVLIFVEIFDKQHCNSTATAPAQAQVWSSNMMPYLSVIIDISISHICWDIYDIWQTALHQHCNSIASGTSWKHIMMPYLSLICIFIIGNSISPSSWDNCQTALYQHCYSISSGSSLMFKHDAIFVYNMYINHWYLNLSH